MTVGILDHVALEKQLMAYATQQGNAMLGVVSKATAYTLSAPSPKAISILRKRMEEKGCPKGTIDVAFAIAKLIAPRIENSVKATSSHEDAMVEVSERIKALKGDLSWKDLKDTLKPAPQGAPAVVPSPVAEVPVVEGEVDTIAPLASVEQTLFDRAMLALPNWSAEQRGAMFQAMLQMCDLETLAAMGEAIVAETEIAAAELVAQAA